MECQRRDVEVTRFYVALPQAHERVDTGGVRQLEASEKDLVKRQALADVASGSIAKGIRRGSAY